MRGAGRKGRLLAFRRIAGQPEEMSDEALVAGAALGDSVAMAALFDRHHLSLHRFLSRLGASVEADDLMHATFIEAFQGASRFRGAASVRTWLFGIAVNISRHHQRGETRRRSFVAALGVEPRGEVARPDHVAERRQLLEKVSVALAALSHGHRAAFLLCDVEELSGLEAAHALAVPAGTVGRWLHEARLALRAALAEGIS